MSLRVTFSKVLHLFYCFGAIVICCVILNIKISTMGIPIPEQPLICFIFHDSQLGLFSYFGCDGFLLILYRGLSLEKLRRICDPSCKDETCEKKCCQLL